MKRKEGEDDVNRRDKKKMEVNMRDEGICAVGVRDLIDRMNENEGVSGKIRRNE